MLEEHFPDLQTDQHACCNGPSCTSMTLNPLIFEVYHRTNMETVNYEFESSSCSGCDPIHGHQNPKRLRCLHDFTRRNWVLFLNFDDFNLNFIEIGGI